MYKATQNFKSYKLGKVKKGQEVPFNQTWLDEGMIEESYGTSTETKPHVNFENSEIK